MEFNATFLISAISFIIFTVIMNKIFYRPLENIMDEREKFIRDSFSDAQNSTEKADSLLKERDEKLEKSVGDAKKLVADRVNAANENSRALTDEAKQKSRDEIFNAKQQFVSQLSDSEKEFYDKAESLAEVISSKVLGGRV